MDNIYNIAIQYAADVRTKEVRGLRIRNTHYIGITKDNSMKMSSVPYFLKNTEYEVGVVFCDYTYLVWSNWDFSQFVFFITKDGIADDKYEENGWCLTLNEPETSRFHTRFRDIFISKGELKVSIRIENRPEAVHLAFGRIWQFFKRAQGCKTQRELDLLKLCFEKDVEIENITKEKLEEETRNINLNQQIQSYKDLLEHIKEIATPTN